VSDYPALSRYVAAIEGLTTAWIGDTEVALRAWCGSCPPARETLAGFLGRYQTSFSITGNK
jgi:hypothetical protein